MTMTRMPAPALIHAGVYSPFHESSSDYSLPHPLVLSFTTVSSYPLMQPHEAIGAQGRLDPAEALLLAAIISVSIHSHRSVFFRLVLPAPT